MKNTGNFDNEKIRIILFDIGVTKSMIRERLENESFEIYKKNGWEIPKSNLDNPVTKEMFKGEKIIIPDYEKMISKTHSGTFYELNKVVNLLESKLNDNIIKDKQPNQTGTPPKQPLTFARLFKHPYNLDTEKLKKKLKEINLIDDNYQWRTVDNNGKKTPSKDIGKFYDWLYTETTVLDKTPDKTAHCICFCAEFGIIAYEGTENKPKTGRTVTAKLIRESTFDIELENKYNTHFKTWINKEK